MKKNYLTQMIIAWMLGFFGLTNANAQFLENTPMVDIVQIPGFNGDGQQVQRYLADVDSAIIFSLDQNEASQWYKIPAGGVSNGTTDVQAYYYKNVSTGKYLVISDSTLSKLATERTGDWPTELAATDSTNDNSLGFKWFERPSNWGWGIYLSNAADIDLTARENNQIYSLTSISLMNGVGGEFFGVYYPNAAVGGFAGGGGNAWTAVKIPVVIQKDAPNPDYTGQDKAISYNIDELNFFATDAGADSTASSYDLATHTITYNKDWSRAGWNFEPQGGLDASYYDQVFLEFDATALAAAGQNPADIKIQYDVTYMDGSQETVTGGGFSQGNEYRADATKVWWTLTKAKTQRIKLITLKSQSPGKVVLTKAYFSKLSINAVDLIVTNVRWEPVNPQPGDSVTFFATIKNDSQFDSPADTKHGVVFMVNKSTVTWCDGFRGPLAAGKEIEVSATMEGSSGSKWKCGNDPTYNIQAQVNDTHDVFESNYDNNYSDIEVMTVNGQADLAVTDVTWTPAQPVANDHVVFTLTVQNIGTVNAPSGINKNVKFYINNEAVTWNNYTTAINIGDAPVKISANAGTLGSVSKFNYWVASNGTFTVKAEVNGDESIEESDYTNNFKEKTLQIGGSGIEEVHANAGNVYVKDGVLYLVNYPNASVIIYSTLGQKIANYEAISDKANISLVSGIYVVSVQYGGKVVNYKVIVK